MFRRVTGFAAFAVLVVSLLSMQSPANARFTASNAAQSTAQSGSALSGTISGGEVKIHRLPNIVVETLTTVKFGDAVTVIGRNTSGTWFQVVTTGGISGWIAATFVKLNTGKTSDIPVVDSTASPISTEDATTCGTLSGVAKATVNTETLILRAQPNTSAPAITILKAGAPLTITGSTASGAWFLVTTGNNLTGWVGSAFVYITAGKSKDIQVIDPVSVTTSAPVATAAATMAATTTAMAATASATAGACPTAVATSAANANTATIKVKVAVTTLNLRNAPVNNAEILKALKVGDELTVKGNSASGAWYLVETSDGIIGWVGSSFVQLTQGKLKDIPTVSNDAVSATEVATPAR